VRDASHDAGAARPAGRSRAAGPERTGQGGLAGAVIALQRTAGNRAVTALLRRPAEAPGRMIQRLAVTTSDLDASIGIGSKGVFGMGHSSFVAIRTSLSRYEKAAAAKGADGDLIQLLDILDAQVTHWLNTHRATDKEGAARRAALQKLEGSVADERRRISQRMEQQVYIEGLAAGARPEQGADVLVPDDPGKHRFKAASTGARVAGAQALEGFSSTIELSKRRQQFLGGDGAIAKQHEARMKLVNERGITPAEHAAILTYTHEAGDFDYINPGMAGIDPWLAANKARVGKTIEAARAAHGPHITGWSDVDDKALKEEADLHTRLAVAGMGKLDPYVGVSYRGESRSEADLRAVAGVGSTHRQHSLVSTSKNEGTAFGFATKNLGPGRDVAVFWIYQHTGAKGFGADVEILSAMSGEGEVLLFPDAPFTIVAMVEVGPGLPAPGGPMAAFHTYLMGQFRAGALASAEKVVLILAVPGKERRKKR
jgi:hypothetical protein